MDSYTDHALISAAIKIASKAGRDAPCTLIRRGAQLYIEAGGEHVQVQTSIPATEKDDSTCTVVVSTLADALRRVGGSTPVRLHGGNKRLTVAAGAASVQIPVIDADQPEPDIAGQVASITLGAGALRDALEGVAYAVSTDPSRYGLNGVCLRGGRLMATDGHRAATWPLGEDVDADGGAALIPPSACSAMLAALATCGDEDSVTLTLRESWHRLDVGGLTLDVRAVAGEFPDLGAVVPKLEGPRLGVDRDALIDAIQTVDLGGSRATVIDPDGTISQRDIATSRDTQTAIVAGDDDTGWRRCGVEASYMIDALRTCRQGPLFLWMAGPLSPLVVDDGTDAVRVVMPRRID
ncbi:MAG TPA: DNA polymerase III subunit beta [Vicinamibacterales bacterium]|nr:DNA polymerase III subunit beta [Vicinamibacterales bacterium]